MADYGAIGMHDELMLSFPHKPQSMVEYMLMIKSSVLSSFK
mgnify:CR=1 FL=1